MGQIDLKKTILWWEIWIFVFSKLVKQVDFYNFNKDGIKDREKKLGKYSRYYHAKLIKDKKIMSSEKFGEDKNPMSLITV